MLSMLSMLSILRIAGTESERSAALLVALGLDLPQLPQTNPESQTRKGQNGQDRYSTQLPS
jgi:hypothetical protein